MRKVAGAPLCGRTASGAGYGPWLSHTQELRPREESGGGGGDSISYPSRDLIERKRLMKLTFQRHDPSIKALSPVELLHCSIYKRIKQISIRISQQESICVLFKQRIHHVRWKRWLIAPTANNDTRQRTRIIFANVNKGCFALGVVNIRFLINLFRTKWTKQPFLISSSLF